MLFNIYAVNGQFITRNSFLDVVRNCEGKTNVNGFSALFNSVRGAPARPRGPGGGGAEGGREETVFRYKVVQRLARYASGKCVASEINGGVIGKVTGLEPG